MRDRERESERQRGRERYIYTEINRQRGMEEYGEGRTKRKHATREKLVMQLAVFISVMSDGR